MKIFRLILCMVVGLLIATMPEFAAAQTTVPSYVEQATGATRNGVGMTPMLQFNSTLPTVTTGLYNGAQITSKGSQRSFMTGTVSTIKAAMTISSVFPGFDTASETFFGTLASAPFLYNGATQDAAVSIAGALANGGVTGATAVEENGVLFNEITTATSTTVKGSAGFLHRICVNTQVASATIKAYNNTSATGTALTITLPSTITSVNPFCMDYDVFFNLGIFVVTSAATDVTVTYR